MILTAALAACGKSEPPAAAPELAAPGKAFSSTEREVPAEATVTASSGPVQITLRIYKTKLKPKDSLWYQIELKNIGKEKILVNDDIFHSISAIRRQSWSKSHGIYLEIIGPDGKAPFLPARNFALDIDPEGMETLPPPDTTEGAGLWKKINGTDDYLKKAEIIRGYWEARRAREKTPEREPDHSFWLEPGTSTTTFAWASQDNVDYQRGEALRPPIGKFTEMHFIYYDPGKHRIRVVYDMTPSPSFLKEFGFRAYPENVFAASSFIEFEVAR